MQTRLFEVVVVEVSIPQRMHKITQFITADLGNHLSQQGVRCNVERHAKKDVGTALVQLAGKFVAVSLDKAAQAKLIDEALNEMGEDTWQN